MTTGVEILGVAKRLDAKEDSLDIKKLEQEFSEGLGTVFAEVKDVELRSNQEIAQMSAEEFYLELDKLENQYDEKIQSIVQKQIAKEIKEKELEKKKAEVSKVQELKLRQKKLAALDQNERVKFLEMEARAMNKESKISIAKYKIENLNLAMKKAEPGSVNFENNIAALEKAQSELEALESTVD